MTFEWLLFLGMGLSFLLGVFLGEKEGYEDALWDYADGKWKDRFNLKNSHKEG